MDDQEFIQAALPPVSDKRLWRIGQMFAAAETEGALTEVLLRLDPLEVLSLCAEVMWVRLENANAETLDAVDELARARKKGSIH